MPSEDGDKHGHPPAGFKGAKVWSRPVVLGVGSGLFLDVSSCPRQAGDIYPADMVGGSMGRLEPWMC